MSKAHWIGLATMAAASMVGGSIIDLIAVAGAAVIAHAGARSHTRG